MKRLILFMTVFCVMIFMITVSSCSIKIQKPDGTLIERHLDAGGAVNVIKALDNATGNIIDGLE